jgi:signal transduction histidine kinase
LRRRLTAWYVGTFLVILLLLGLGLFGFITRRLDNDLDASLRAAARALADRAAADGLADASRSIVVPDRRLLIVDALGRSVAGDSIEPWITDFAMHAPATGHGITHDVGHETILRGFAQPFVARGGGRFTAVALASEVELEDQYTVLILVAAGAGIVATVLVGVGGWIVARQSTDPVERSVVQMRRFMADAAHELRTPLSVIRSRAEVALQRPRDEHQYAEALQGIEREATRVGRIVEDLLILARADAGERPIERQRVFLDDVTLDAAEAARALAARKQVRVDVDEFEEAPLSGDAVLLRQLVLILLDNAIKFSPERGVVRVAVRRDGGAQLTIRDTGPGIPPPQLPHVFERFYRGDAARTRADGGGSEGAGLGLSIAKWIAGEHGAGIRIDSAPGMGTTVTVSFPESEPLSSS